MSPVPPTQYPLAAKAAAYPRTPPEEDDEPYLRECETLRPSFEQLPLSPADPQWSAWGLWGDNDEVGTLNLLTPTVVKRAVKQVREGKLVPLKSVTPFSWGLSRAFWTEGAQ